MWMKTIILLLILSTFLSDAFPKDGNLIDNYEDDFGDFSEFFVPYNAGVSNDKPEVVEEIIIYEGDDTGYNATDTELGFGNSTEVPLKK